MGNKARPNNSKFILQQLVMINNCCPSTFPHGKETVKIQLLIKTHTERYPCCSAEKFYPEVSGCSPGWSVPEESTAPPPSASVAGSLVLHRTPPCPHCCCPFVSWVLEIPDIPAAVLRSFIHRGGDGQAPMKKFLQQPERQHDISRIQESRN